MAKSKNVLDKLDTLIDKRDQHPQNRRRFIEVDLTDKESIEILKSIREYQSKSKGV